jgi:hypothetical protein
MNGASRYPTGDVAVCGHPQARSVPTQQVPNTAPSRSTATGLAKISSCRHRSGGYRSPDRCQPRTTAGSACPGADISRCAHRLSVSLGVRCDGAGATRWTLLGLFANRCRAAPHHRDFGSSPLGERDRDHGHHPYRNGDGMPVRRCDPLCCTPVPGRVILGAGGRGFVDHRLQRVLLRTCLWDPRGRAERSAHLAGLPVPRHSANGGTTASAGCPVA